MGVLLLKLELLSETEKIDTTEFYNGKAPEFSKIELLKMTVLLRMIRTIVLSETNFKAYVTRTMPG